MQNKPPIYICPKCKTKNYSWLKRCQNCGALLLDLETRGHPKKNKNYINIFSIVLLLIVMFTLSKTIHFDSSNLNLNTNLLNLPMNKSEALQTLNFNNAITRDFSWDYNGFSYRWTVGAPIDLLNWDKSIQKTLNAYVNSKSGYGQKMLLSSAPDNIKILINSRVSNNLVSWVIEDSNLKYTNFLAEILKDHAHKSKFDYFHTAEFALSFVGSIPYEVQETQLPAQTIIENGDCDCKSVLYASILLNMGYKVSLLSYPNHMAVGIAFEDNQVIGNKLSFYNHNGTNYYYCETTTPGWGIGKLNNEMAVTTAAIYPIN